MKNKLIGVLFYNNHNERMDIKYNDGTVEGGLHCGTTFEVKINGKYVQTRIEYSDDWYLVGIKTDSLEGLQVRV